MQTSTSVWKMYLMYLLYPCVTPQWSVPTHSEDMSVCVHLERYLWTESVRLVGSVWESHYTYSLLLIHTTHIPHTPPTHTTHHTHHTPHTPHTTHTHTPHTPHRRNSNSTSTNEYTWWGKIQCYCYSVEWIHPFHGTLTHTLHTHTHTFTHSHTLTHTHSHTPQFTQMTQERFRVIVADNINNYCDVNECEATNENEFTPTR